MTPWVALQWVGVTGGGLLFLALCIVALRAATSKSTPCPDPTAHEAEDEGRSVDL
jgi:hypothetical protein